VVQDMNLSFFLIPESDLWLCDLIHTLQRSIGQSALKIASSYGGMPLALNLWRRSLCVIFFPLFFTVFPRITSILSDE
jgi:hypothetical protein